MYISVRKFHGLEINALVSYFFFISSTKPLTMKMMTTSTIIPAPIQMASNGMGMPRKVGTSVSAAAPAASSANASGNMVMSPLIE